MLTYPLLNLQEIARAIGRGVCYYANVWDGTTNLTLTHLGDTEGEITFPTQEAIEYLELPELTGPGKHKGYVTGEDGLVTMPLFYADPALRAIASASANASGGYTRRRPVKERTLVIFPEELFWNPATEEYGEIAYDGTAWTLDTVAFTAKQTELLGLSTWFWRGHFLKAGSTFKHGEAGKNVQNVQFQPMLSELPLALIPEGNRLYTIGDPANRTIDIHPVVA